MSTTGIMDLPVDIQQNITALLDVHSQIALAQVSRTFTPLCNPLIRPSYRSFIDHLIALVRAQATYTEADNVRFTYRIAEDTSAQQLVVVMCSHPKQYAITLTTESSSATSYYPIVDTRLLILCDTTQSFIQACEQQLRDPVFANELAFCGKYAMMCPRRPDCCGCSSCAFSKKNKNKNAHAHAPPPGHSVTVHQALKEFFVIATDSRKPLQFHISYAHQKLFGVTLMPTMEHMNKLHAMFIVAKSVIPVSRGSPSPFQPSPQDLQTEIFENDGTYHHMGFH